MPGESGHSTCPTTYPLLGQLKELKKNQKTAPTSSQKIPNSSNGVWILHRWPFESVKTGSQGSRHLFRRLFRLKAAGVAFDTLGYASEGFWQSADFSICFQSVNAGSGLFYPKYWGKWNNDWVCSMQLSSPEVSGQLSASSQSPDEASNASNHLTGKRLDPRELSVRSVLFRKFRSVPKSN